MGVVSKIKEFCELHKTSGLYKDSFENTIFKLTNAYDYFFLELYRDAKIGKLSSKKEGIEDLDRLRHAYRACIKFINEDCYHGDFKQCLNLSDIRNFQKEMKETIQFNFIRNIVDRYKLRRFTASEKNNILTFKHVKNDRPIIYDVYQRNIADTIPFAKHTKDNINVFNFNLKIIEIARNKPEFQSKKIFKPIKHKILELINELVPYYLDGLDIEFNALRGSEYCLGDYLLFYCYLVTIGIYKTAYLMSLCSENEQVYQPSIVYPKERLIKDVIDITGMSETTARQVLSDLTYDYDFHKNRLTIYQPVFEVGENILCSTNMLFQSYVVDKIMKYFDVKGTNKKDLTLYHRNRAIIMNHRMADNIPLIYPNLKTYENCVLRIGGNSKSEIDLIVFDDNTRTAALIELKNYTPVDNEEDAINREKRINKAIKTRLVRDKLVINNIEVFLKQNDIPPKYAEYNYRSLLVTNISVGGVGVKESIKVVDEVLFYNLLCSCRGNLLKTLDTIDSGGFFKILESKVRINNTQYEYKGLKVKVIYK